MARLAGLFVDGDQIFQRGLGNHAEAGAESKSILQAAGDDRVGDADVDDVGQVVARRGLGGGKTDAAGVAADDGADAGRIHLLDLGIAAIGGGLRVAEHRLDLCADLLDAAGSVDLVDRDRGAEPALLAGIGQRARYRLQEADLYGSALRAQNRGCRQHTTGGCGSRERRCLQKFAAGNAVVVA